MTDYAELVKRLREKHGNCTPDKCVYKDAGGCCNLQAVLAIEQLEHELHKIEMEMPDYKQCCALREIAERELYKARERLPQRAAKRRKK